MAINRVEGPMLLTNLDRQGIDLQFTTSNAPLLYLDFSNFKVSLLQNTQPTPYTFNVAGNGVIGNVVFEKNARITSQAQNQTLYIQANGTANVQVTNANIISGRVDGTVIGGINPREGTFTYLQSNAMATLFQANINNLSATRVPFTAANGSMLVDDASMYFDKTTGTLYLNSLQTTQQQVFSTLSGANIVLRTATVTQIPYFATNSYMLTSNAFTFTGYAGVASQANLLTTGNLSLTQINSGNILFIDGSDGNKVKGIPIAYDPGSGLRANTTVRFNDVVVFNNKITVANPDQDLQLSPLNGNVDVNGNFIGNVRYPVNDGDAVNKVYVDQRFIAVQSTSKRIFQGLNNTYVDASDDNFNTPNVSISVSGFQYAQFQTGFANILGLTIDEDNRISTHGGDIRLRPFPYDGSRVVIDSNSAITLPYGGISNRPALPNLGDFRFNVDIASVEWWDGTNWDSLVSNATMSTYTITPDGVSNTFTMPQEATSVSVMVNFNGVVQTPGVTYYCLGNQITFTSTPLVSDIIDIRFFTATISQATNPVKVDRMWTSIDTASVSNVVVAYSGTPQVAGGAGYKVGDVVTVIGGNAITIANIRITAVNTLTGNAVASLTVLNGGTYGGYGLATNPVTLAGGSGVGLQANLGYTVSSSLTVIDSWGITANVGYRGAKYTYVAKSKVNGYYETGDIHVVHDGVTTYPTFSGKASNLANSWLSWSTIITAQNVFQLAVRGNNAAYDTQIKFHATYFGDN